MLHKIVGPVKTDDKCNNLLHMLPRFIYYLFTNKTFFRYKEISTIGIITIEIVMLDTIFPVEIVLIKKNYSFHSKVQDDTCIYSSFLDFDHA